MARAASENAIVDYEIWNTPEGGVAIQLINDTGSASVKGKVVAASPDMNGAVELVTDVNPVPIGIIYDDGIAHGEKVWVVISGIALLLVAGSCNPGDIARCFSPSESGYVAGYAKSFAPTVGQTGNVFEIGTVIEKRNDAGYVRVVLQTTRNNINANEVWEEFDPDKIYAAGEKAYYPVTGSSYRMKVASGVAGTLPTDTQYWQIVAQQGDAGTINTSTNTNLTGVLAGSGTKVRAVTAADTDAQPFTDTNSRFTTDEVGDALVQLGEQVAGASASGLRTQIIEKTSYGVITGLGVTQQTVPDMTVRVATGTIYMSNGDRFTPTANNALAITAADATNPRWDIVYVSSAGVISYLAGTAAASPSVPSVPAGGQKLAEIYVAAGDTAIGTAEIYDRRKGLWTEAWIAPTLLNSWVDYSTGSAIKYAKDVNGTVRIKGAIKSGTTEPGTAMFILPIGYRPAATLYSIVNSNFGLGTIYIFSDGNVKTNNVSATLLSFDGLTFRAEG